MNDCDYYLSLLEEGYKEMLDEDDNADNRLCYLSDYIFDFTTYDGELDCLFATKAMEVCDAITQRETFNYIAKNNENYRWFIIMCNMPFFSTKITWGTSIRGAFWDSEIAFKSLGFWRGGEQFLEVLNFKNGEWVAFVNALTIFLGEKEEEIMKEARA